MDYADEEETDEQSMLEDLQLAAELGKTLLERNKELETSLKQHQNLIEDQAQEIEYLTKQTAALREVNDSRLRIYEQLEVSIQELERTNQRLAVENTTDKKHIKSLCLTIDSLESKCEELQRALDEITTQQDTQKRLQENESSTTNCVDSALSATQKTSKFASETVKTILSDATSNSEDEVVRLLGQIRELKNQRAKDQRKTGELEEQLAAIMQENLTLEEKLNFMQQKEDDMKSLQEEMLTLEEVRQGQLCRRCLRTIDTRDQDELSLVMDREDDEISVVNSVTSETHCSTVMMQIQNMEEEHHDNPYRILVEKYEALLEMQRHPTVSRQHSVATSNNCLSLQEELQLSGDFNSFTGKEEVESDPEPEETKANTNSKGRKPNGNVGDKPFSCTTPTDFSEAETSSSGFSDETSNKATQTEGHLLPPGSFLCSIADGDDCRFSIYDDASPIESRFRKTPEYRQLFREIFAVLKRAAEAKDEGEQLPLLEDSTPVVDVPKVPPATPAKEEQPSNFVPAEKREEAKSTVQENCKQEAPVTKVTETATKHSNSRSTKASPTEEAVSNADLETKKKIEDTQSKPVPKKDYLDYLSAGVGIKKKSNSKKNTPMKNLKASVQERVERLEQLNSLGIGMSFSTRHYKKRKDIRNVDTSDDRSCSPSLGSNGGYRRDEGPRRSSYTQPSCYDKSWDVQTYPSTASQEVAKLKRLEKSYAEVLRLGPQKSNRPSGITHYRK